MYPSEIVTIGLMFALKGGKYRPFYRWLVANQGRWFPKLPEQSRLLRLVHDYGHYTERLLKEPTVFTVIDTFRELATQCEGETITLSDLGFRKMQAPIYFNPRLLELYQADHTAGTQSMESLLDWMQWSNDAEQSEQTPVDEVWPR